MVNVTFTKFRENAASYFDKVEKGEAVQIYRKGKPSALLVKAGTRIGAEVDSKAYWKNARPLIELGTDLASRILKGKKKGMVVQAATDEYIRSLRGSMKLKGGGVKSLLASRRRDRRAGA